MSARLLAAVLLFAGGAIVGKDVPATPSRWVTDAAGSLAPETVRALDARLENYQRTSGHQVVVYIGTTTGSAPIEEWSANTFGRWGIGKKGKDDGAALFVFRDDRTARIEVGYGLEDRLTDLATNRILQERVLPRMKSGDPDGAISAGVESILAGIDGRAPPAVQTGPGEIALNLSPLQWVFAAIAGALLLFFLVTHPTLALWMLMNLAAGARRGGGGGSGFSGGGGRSGGGGASGSW